MLDIKFIRESQKELKKAIKNKGIDLDLDKLLAVDDKRVGLLREIEKLNAEKNNINNLIRSAKTEKERKKIIEDGRKIKNKIETIEPKFKKIQQEFDLLMAKVPIIPSPDTPIGKNEADNAEIYRWGEKPKLAFSPKDHIELGKQLDILDMERGKKVAGYRGYYLKNEGAQLVMAMMMYAFNKMVKRGYIPMIPPTLVKGFSLFGTGYFKGLKYDDKVDELYQIAGSDKEAGGAISKEKKFLVGTAEPSLLAYYAGEVLKEENLPLKISGYSQCYRSEIGSYGKDTKGIYRVHEFMKIEQVIICKADIKEAEKLQEEMLGISKEILEELGLLYRQIIICAGDLSPGKYRQYDLEVYSAANDWYRECGSASIFLDWQARRLNVKYADKEGKKKYVYMLNNTGLASPRILIAILENYQQADGSVKIPKVLREYMGKDIIRPRK
ncbi:serine--tRNA ligase [Patescibacteria group bacterium]|nr:serine--tRNA ligase [Patescibacteria group bacterium]MBU4000048.1 serine--tRNA ligase [Patescibacteria group bacterium]MBU4056300.1 serine--tRNA ligase [Patescibacteria group bacterium]MBU4368297.1 serine--tRNA ligase [Patescibacteria group bacterium]